MEPVQKARRGPKRGRAQRAADLTEIAALVLKGKNQYEIADIMSKRRPYTLSRAQIQYDVASLTARWEAAAVESIAKLRARAFIELGLISTQAWEQWDTSLLQKAPNAAFLKLVLDAHDRRAKLLGFESSARVEITGAGGGAIQIEAEAVPLDQEAKMAVLKRHLERMQEDAQTPALALPNG